MRSELLGLLFGSVVTAGCGSSLSACDAMVPLSDLRPPALVQHGIAPAAEARGRELLRQSAVAHGSAAFDAHTTWEVVLEDRWSDAPLIQRRSPWPAGSTWLKLQFVAGTSNGRVEFLDGPLQGTIWGRVGDRTYALPPGGPAQWDAAPAMASRLPTMQFLFAFPQRIQQAPHVAHVGRSELAGRAVDVVFAAWGSVAPDPHADQFLVYLDADDHQVVAMQYTVRKSGRTLLGHRFWSDLRPVEGALVPFFQSSVLELDPEAAPVHSFVVRSLAFDTVPRQAIEEVDLSP